MLRSAEQRVAAGIVVIGIVVVVLLLRGGGDDRPTGTAASGSGPAPASTATAARATAPRTTARASVPARADRPFAPTSFWNARIPDDIAFSDARVALGGRERAVNPTVGRELQGFAVGPGGAPNTWVLVRSESAHVVEVPADQPLEPVRLCRSAQECVPSWARTVDQLLRGVDVRGRSLGGGVPVPADVPLPSAANLDAPIVFYQPGYRGPGGVRGRAYELFHFRRDPTYDPGRPLGPGNTRYVAAWGGRMVDVVGRGVGHYADCLTSSCGYQADVARDPSAWGRPNSQAESRGWGPSASGLPLLGSQMSLQDCRRGGLDHAMGLEVPRARRGASWWPAQRSDGVADDRVVTEGMRLTFPRGARPPAGLTPVGLAVWRAAYTYGLVVDDQTARNLAFRAEPGCESTELFRSSGVPTWALLRDFPWSDLRVIAEGSDREPNPTR